MRKGPPLRKAIEPSTGSFSRSISPKSPAAGRELDPTVNSAFVQTNFIRDRNRIDNSQATLIAELQATCAGGLDHNEPGEQGGGLATLIPLPHTPNGGYLNTEIAALH